MSDRTPELKAALEREAATREILRVINRSPGDYQPVFEAILENAARLCDAPLGLLLIREEDGFHFVAERGCRPETMEYFRANPLPLDPEHSVTARTAVERRPIQVPDLTADPLSKTGQPHRRLGIEVEGVRTQLTVPMLRGDECVGVIIVYRREVRAFDDDQVALLSSFADQAVIAIENVRQFQQVQSRTADLTRSLEHQTATSEILRSISRSPTDYNPVFDTILTNAVRLCGAPFGVLFLLRDDHLHAVAFMGTRPEFIEYRRANPIPIMDGNVLGATAVERIPKQVEDLMVEAFRSGIKHRIDSVMVGGVRTLLGVPMLKGDETVGVIALYREEVQTFDDDDIELVRTFADQAVIAIENVRLFQALEDRNTALDKSLERQTATSEILRVISRSPADYQPVFEAILENAVRLCRAPFGSLFLVRDGQLHFVADVGSHPEFIEYLRDNPYRLDDPVALVSRAARERAPRQIADLMDDAYRAGEPVRIASVQLGQMRTLLGVPILKNDETIGLIALYRREVDAFSDSEIDLVRVFADQAVIAIENVRQFQAVQEHTAALTQSLERQTATSEILRAINRSPTDYQPVFDVILDNALRLCRAPRGNLLLQRDRHLHLVSSAGETSEFIEHMKANPLSIDRPNSVTGRAAREQAVVNVPDMVAELLPADAAQSRVVELSGTRSLLAVPILRGEVTVGVLALYRQEVKPFADDDVVLVRTFADQAVIAIENVRQFQQVQARTADLTQSLERQTATSEILRSISQSPTDYVPVFDAILDNATRLCDAPLAFLLMREGDAFHLVAHRGSRAEFIDFLLANPLPADSEGALAAVAGREGVPKQLEDITDSDAYRSGSNIHRVASADLEGIRTGLFVPMMKGKECAGIIALYRREVRAFHESHLALVSTFADQAVIAIDNVRLFQALEARTQDLSELLERQTATSEILRTISRSPTDYQPVFEAILDNALRLCHAPIGMLMLRRGDHLHYAASRGQQLAMVEFLRANPMPLDRQHGIAARAAREGVPVQSADLAAEPRAGDRFRTGAVELGGVRSLLAVPLRKGDESIGVLSLYRQEVKPFDDSEVELTDTFADQAVIAIENVRLFQALEARTAALTRTLERQTATSEILRSISRSPTNYQPVFETILDNATRLCGAPFGTLYLLSDDQWHCVADAGSRPELVVHMQANPLPRADTSTVVGSAASKRAPVQVTDLMEDAKRSGNARRIASAEMGGVRTLLGVPLLKNDEAVGVMTLYRQQVERFAEDDIELVSTFADQAVIAIENVRLFQALESRTNDLSELLERQTATSEILRSISRSPTDYQPVFDTILRNGIRLCDAHFAGLFLIRGDHLEHSASLGGSAEFVEFARDAAYPIDLPGSLIGRAARERMPQHEVDVRDSERYRAREKFRVGTVELGGIRTMLAVPLCRGEETLGVLALFRQEVRAFGDDEIELVRTFADQAVIAMENVRLFQTAEARSAELAKSVAELEALGDVAQAVSSSLDLETVLNTIVERAVQLSGASLGAINELDEATGTLPPRAAPGAEKMLELPAPRLGEGAVGRAAATRTPVQIPDITVPGAYTGRLLDALSDMRIRALLAVPMVQDDSVLGTLVVARRTPGEFPAETVRVLQALGTQSAIAIRNARLFREIEEQSRELEAANQHKSEFLANMSHELRTPLNAVIGFSEVLGERMFGELNDKQAEYVTDIHDSGRHLLSLINDILDLSKIEAGAMELDVGRFALGPALDNALTLVKERAGRRGITLEPQVAGDLGEMEGDERKLKQILLNLLSNAIKFTDTGGKVTLEAMGDGTSVHIAVRDTGVGISPEDQAVIFDEFKQVGTDFARKVEGTGLGLTLTRRFVEMHGGSLSVESEPGVGSVFRVTLPVRPPEPLESMQ